MPIIFCSSFWCDSFSSSHHTATVREKPATVMLRYNGVNNPFEPVCYDTMMKIDRISTAKF